MLLARAGILALIATGSACSGPKRSQPLTPNVTPAPLPAPATHAAPVGIDAAASTHVPIKVHDDDDGCIADQGCPFAPAPIPNCPERTQAKGLAEVLGSKVEGSKSMASVTGQLWVQPLVQLLECALGCCNAAHGNIQLRDGEARIVLADDRFQDAFRCSGDDSRICCGFDGVRDSTRSVEVPYVVVATGELDRDTTPATLRRPRLCRLASQDAPAVACNNAEENKVTELDGAMRCACHRGVARCTSDKSACYSTGVWHKESTSLDIGGTCRNRNCHAGQWQLGVDECPRE